MEQINNNPQTGAAFQGKECAPKFLLSVKSKLKEAIPFKNGNRMVYSFLIISLLLIFRSNDVFAYHETLSQTYYSPQPYSSQDIEIDPGITIGLSSGSSYHVDPGFRIIVDNGAVLHVFGSSSAISLEGDIEIQNGGVVIFDCDASVINANIDVQGGGEIHFNGQTTQFDVNKLLHIENQGACFITNSTLKCSSPGQMWQGIFVEHDGTTFTSYSTQCGVVYMYPGSKIERATCGIHSSGGGVILALQSTFLNCLNSIKVDNFSVGNVRADIRECGFETNTLINTNKCQDAFIKLNGVKGVLIAGCSFINSVDWLSFVGSIIGGTPNPRGNGIESINSSFDLIPSGSIGYMSGSGCPVYGSPICTFQNLGYAIKADGNFSGTYNYIYGATFIDNTIGISDKNTRYSVIRNNIFTIDGQYADVHHYSYYDPLDLLEVCSSTEQTAASIYMQGSENFDITENSIFMGVDFNTPQMSGGIQFPESGVGIYVNNSGLNGLASRLYANTINMQIDLANKSQCGGQFIGTRMAGNNSQLELSCNQYNMKSGTSKFAQSAACQTVSDWQICISGCSGITQPSLKNQGSSSVSANNIFTNFNGFEDFESNTKTAYPLPSPPQTTFSTGDWLLDDAIIGTSSSDIKRGLHSVRIKNTGKLTMDFDISMVTAVSIKNATFLGSANSDWEMWESTDGGSSWFILSLQEAPFSSTINSTSTLSTYTFVATLASAQRFEIRKTSVGSDQLNFDDFQFMGLHQYNIEIKDFNTPPLFTYFQFSGAGASTMPNIIWPEDQVNLSLMGTGTECLGASCYNFYLNTGGGTSGGGGPNDAPMIDQTKTAVTEYKNAANKSFISPNPVTDYLSFNPAKDELAVHYSFTITDALGKEIQLRSDQIDNQYTFDTRNLSVGLYLMNVIDGMGQRQVFKFLKVK